MVGKRKTFEANPCRGFLPFLTRSNCAIILSEVFLWRRIDLDSFESANL